MGAFLELLEATARHAADYPVGPPSYDVLLTLGHMYVSRSLHVMLNAVLVKSPVERYVVRAEGPGNLL